MRKLRFYLLGFIPGLLIVFFILNKKGAKCSGYLPNSRVIAETLSKDFRYTDGFKNQIQSLKIDSTFLKDSILTEGEILFDRSQAQKLPCPSYILVYPDKNPRFEVSFEKCDDYAQFFTIKSLK